MPNTSDRTKWLFVLLILTYAFFNSSYATSFLSQPYEGENIIILKDVIDQINKVFLNNTTEYFGCLNGYISGNILFLNSFKLQEVKNSTTIHVTTTACNPLNYVDIHSHPKGICALSETDKQSSQNILAFFSEKYNKFNFGFSCVQCSVNQISCWNIMNNFSSMNVGF